MHTARSLSEHLCAWHDRDKRYWRNDQRHFLANVAAGAILCLLLLGRQVPVLAPTFARHATAITILAFISTVWVVVGNLAAIWQTLAQSRDIRQVARRLADQTGALESEALDACIALAAKSSDVHLRTKLHGMLAPLLMTAAEADFAVISRDGWSRLCRIVATGPAEPWSVTDGSLLLGIFRALPHGDRRSARSAVSRILARAETARYPQEVCAAAERCLGALSSGADGPMTLLRPAGQTPSCAGELVSPSDAPATAVRPDERG